EKDAQRHPPGITQPSGKSMPETCFHLEPLARSTRKEWNSDSWRKGTIPVCECAYLAVLVVRVPPCLADVVTLMLKFSSMSPRSRAPLTKDRRPTVNCTSGVSKVAAMLLPAK